jgi:CDP-glucose 4,6-dehydratase
MIFGEEKRLGRFGETENMNLYWKDKNVFVTGATGLLGSWLVKALVDNNANVVCLVRDAVPKSNLYQSGYHKKVVMVNGGLEDYFVIERTLNEYEVDTVFHLGAQTIVGTANRSPLATFESNIKGTWNVLEAARNSRLVERITVASSDKAYGEQENLPYTEDMPLKGRHPYDVSKSCADLIAQSYYYTYDLPVGITRCGNFYGGGDLNFNRIVSGTIKSILNNECPVIRSDGKYIRDYIFILDAVEAYLFLAEKLDNPAIRSAFNFSNESQVTVLDVVKKILKLMNREDLEPVILNEAKSEIKHQYLSAEKARKRLGWKPKYNLDSGLRKTIEWYKEFFGYK